MKEQQVGVLQQCFNRKPMQPEVLTAIKTKGRLFTSSSSLFQEEISALCAIHNSLSWYGGDGILTYRVNEAECQWTQTLSNQIT